MVFATDVLFYVDKKIIIIKVFKMKKTKKITNILICLSAIIYLIPLFCASAANDDFKLNISIDNNDIHPGDKFNIIFSLDKIVPESGLCGLNFTLTYDTAVLEPVIVSDNPEDTSPYDVFMT